MKRNYKRLMAINKSDIGIDLSFLDGFRSILCLLILAEHSGFILVWPHEHSDFVETFLNSMWIKTIQAGFVWVELFFLITGLLLYVKFEKSRYITTESSFGDCVNVFVRLIASRYLR